tara:strand:+ start:1228 stop:1845 length:618 start_codon:yes stop_codon:yes gene_type:complete
MTAKIKLNAASGGGSFSLQAPSSSANTRVMTLPDTADGTILTTTNPRTGNSLQVVQTVKTDAFTTTSSSLVDVTGMSATITPTSTSSKILVEVHIGISGGAQYSYAHYVLLRGSTQIGIGTGATGSNQTNISFATNWNTPNEYIGHAASFQFLDSPSTTSATTYKLQVKSGYASKALYVNRVNASYDETYNAKTASTFTLTEVAG